MRTPPMVYMAFAGESLTPENDKALRDKQSWKARWEKTLRYTVVPDDAPEVRPEGGWFARAMTTEMRGVIWDMRRRGLAALWRDGRGE